MDDFPAVKRLKSGVVAFGHSATARPIGTVPKATLFTALPIMLC